MRRQHQPDFFTTLLLTVAVCCGFGQAGDEAIRVEVAAIHESVPVAKYERLTMETLPAINVYGSQFFIRNYTVVKWIAAAYEVPELLVSGPGWIAFPAKKRPAYTTVQTTVYRLEAKKVLRRTRKIATALIFEAAVSREAAQRRLVDELLGLFGGRSRPIMAHLIESGTLTLEDVREAERTLLRLAGEEKQK
ncbi:MAG TPA: BlaI/MecI/CopY family transcriptional regulator [Candidatus Limnocylindrales bacterium]|nr:BlaI/MecI/CopY family transcriptional regulator [Candidatus Limnocylindrales bacterium]